MTTRINHPKHYRLCSKLGVEIFEASNFHYPEYLKLECIEAVIKLNLDFCLGNCFKYLWRLGEKENFFGFQRRKKIKEDLGKALWYMDRYLAECEIRHCEVFPWVHSLRHVIQERFWRYCQGFW